MIYKKLLQFQKGGVTVKKDAPNPFFKSKYVTLNEVLDKVKAPLNDLGIVIIQESMVGGLLTRLVDTEDDTQVTGFFPYVEVATAQKIGSNITYGRRYSLVALLALEDEDDDGNVASGLTKKPFNKVPSNDVPVIQQDRTSMETVCHCGLEGKKLQTKKISKDGRPAGSWYFACPKGFKDETKCNFFQWAEVGDEPTNYEGDRKVDFNQETGELL